MSDVNGQSLVKISTAAVIIIIVVLLDHVQTTMINRFHSNLVLYGGDRFFSKDQRKVFFTNSELASWKNLTQLVDDAGLDQKSLLCGVGHGTWLAYPKDDYKYDPNEKGFVYLIIGDGCLPADSINSVQPISPVVGTDDYLVVFKDVYFGSEGEHLTNGSSASGIKSLIYPGGHSDKWTVEGGGKKLCIYRPESLLADGVCFMPDFKAQLGADEVSIKNGCENMDGSAEELDHAADTFQLQTCFEADGVYRILTNYMTLPVLKTICSGSADEATKMGFVRIMDAWNYRMDPELQMEYNPVNMDKNKMDDKTPIRMKILTSFFSIFDAGCPVLDNEYFNIIRFIFMMHIKDVWEEAANKIFQEEMKHNATETYEFLTDCFEKRMADKDLPPPAVEECDMSPPSDSPKKDAEADAVDLFLSGDELDPVIEQVWMMLSYVGSYCTKLYNFDDNKWANFVNMFRREFLLPLLQQWANPGTWRTYYSYIFNGFDFEKGKRQVINCVQAEMRLTPNLDPVDRPSAGVMEFMNLSKKKPLVTLKPKPTVGSRRKRGIKDDSKSTQIYSNDVIFYPNNDPRNGKKRKMPMFHQQYMKYLETQDKILKAKFGMKAETQSGTKTETESGTNP